MTKNSPMPCDDPDVHWRYPEAAEIITELRAEVQRLRQAQIVATLSTGPKWRAPEAIKGTRHDLCPLCREHLQGETESELQAAMKSHLFNAHAADFVEGGAVASEAHGDECECEECYYAREDRCDCQGSDSRYCAKHGDGDGDYYGRRWA